MTIEVVREPADWRRLQPAWDALYEACPTVGPPLSYAWLESWRRTYGPAYAAPGGLRVVLGRHDGQLVAAAPLYLARPRGRLRLTELRPLSTGEAEHEETCADYLAPLALPGCLDPFLTAFAAAAGRGELGRFDRLVWPSVAEPEPLAVALGPGARTVSQGDCYLLDLSGGYEAYLLRLSRETRRKTRRLLSEMEASHLTFEIGADAATMTDIFEELVVLHQARWQAVGQAGCYASERFGAFHRTLLTKLTPRTSLVLARLRHQSQTLAAIQGFRHGGKLDFYQSGVVLDAGDLTRNAGVTCYLACLRELADEGVETADFLLGDAIYKQRQSTARRPLWRVTAPSRSLRGRLAEALERRRVEA